MVFKIERTYQISSAMDKKRLVFMHIAVQFQRPEIKEIKTQEGCRLDFKIKQEKRSRSHVKDQESVNRLMVAASFPPRTRHRLYSPSAHHAQAHVITEREVVPSTSSLKGNSLGKNRTRDAQGCSLKTVKDN